MNIKVIKDKVRNQEYVYSLHADIERKADELTFRQVEGALMNKKCNFCGGSEYDDRRTDYLYSYKGNYLLVPNTPVEVCKTCGMVYYPAKVLKEIEEHFFDIQKKKIEPDNYLEIPKWAYAG